MIFIEIKFYYGSYFLTLEMYLVSKNRNENKAGMKLNYNII